MYSENEKLDSSFILDNEENLPNYIGVLTLGICSIIPGSCCYGIVGIICGIIALVLSSKSKKLLKEDPNRYSEKSKSLTKAGRICAIVGISISAIYIIVIVVYLVFLGNVLMNLPKY
jgi:hypothetical protein